MEQRFIDKVVVTTGAAGGIGKAVSKRFYDEGAKVVMLDLRQEWVDAAVTDLGMNPDRVMAVALDVTDEEAARSLVDLVVARWGRIDVLNNVAGVGGDQGPMEEKPMGEWESVYDINVFGTVRMIKYVLPIMKAQGSGVVTNTSSVSGMFGYAGESAYGSSKWAVRGLTKNIANESGSYGVRVNSVAPGWVNTAIFQKALDDYRAEGYEDPMENVTFGPLGRAAEPSEIAAIFAFLASDDAAIINGSNILCDGGMTLG
ncbi:MAG: SDR family oxidoreductase [Atopobiaceae bacterium]|nr:SDR family oxidoreductase [Atopobiaceae bacterium]